MKKVIILFCVVIVLSEVKSDCSDFLECFGDVFKNLFSPDFKTGDNINNTEIVENGAKVFNINDKNVSVHSFDISHIDDDLNKALKEATNRVKQQLESKLKIAAETELYKQLNNKSDVAVKIFDLEDLPKDVWAIDDTVNVNDDSISLISKFDEDTINTTDNPESEQVSLGIINVEDTFDINTEIPIDIKDIPDNKYDYESYGTKYTTDNYVQVPDKPTDAITNIFEGIQNNNNDQKQSTKEINNWKILEQIEKELELNNTNDLNITVLNDSKIDNKYLPKPEPTIHNITIIRPTLKSTTDVNNNYQGKQIKDLASNDIISTTIDVPESTNYNDKQNQYNLDNNKNPKKDNSKDFDVFNFDERLNEISKTYQDYEEYYDSNIQNGTDYNGIDYIELYKDTTNEDDGYKPTEPVVVYSNQIDLNDVSEVSNYNTSDIFPWVSTIFVKNQTNDQFDYVCDGAVLSENIVLTAARCIKFTDLNVVPEDIIIITGKRSLQFTEPTESVHRVKEIKLHPNFSIQGDDATNDLVMLILDEPITFGDGVVQAANINFDDDEDDAFTTGWAVSGNLTAIHFNKEKSKNCFKISKAENTFCATYGNAEPTCPSFSGLYVANSSGEWILRGIRTDDNTKTNFCLSRDVTFTSLKNYMDWINNSVNKV